MSALSAMSDHVLIQRCRGLEVRLRGGNSMRNDAIEAQSSRVEGENRRERATSGLRDLVNNECRTR